MTFVVLYGAILVGTYVAVFKIKVFNFIIPRHFLPRYSSILNGTPTKIYSCYSEYDFDNGILISLKKFHGKTKKIARDNWAATIGVVLGEWIGLRAQVVLKIKNLNQHFRVIIRINRGDSCSHSQQYIDVYLSITLFNYDNTIPSLFFFCIACRLSLTIHWGVLLFVLYNIFNIGYLLPRYRKL